MHESELKSLQIKMFFCYVRLQRVQIHFPVIDYYIYLLLLIFVQDILFLSLIHIEENLRC